MWRHYSGAAFIRRSGDAQDNARQTVLTPHLDKCLLCGRKTAFMEKTMSLINRSIVTKSLLALTLSASLMGCENNTQNGALIGALGGAAVGGVIGGNSHQRAGEGALIGAGVGAIGGALIGNQMDKNEEKQMQTRQEEQYQAQQQYNQQYYDAYGRPIQPR